MRFLRIVYSTTLSNASYSSSIDIEATPSYNGSTVTFYQAVDQADSVLIGSSGANIALVGGTQNTFLLVVLNTNGNLKVQMQYEIVVKRPKPACDSSELSEW